MDDDIINKDFDDFLKKRYENHIIEPERALWEGINARLYQKKFDNSFRKVRNLKVATASLVMSLVATFIYFEIKIQKYQPEAQSISEIAKTEASSDNLSDNISPLKQSNFTKGEKSDSINNVSKLASNLSIVGSSENKPNADDNLSSSNLALKMDILNNYPSTLMTNGIRDSSIIGTNNVKAFEKIKISIGMEPASLKFFEPITSILPIIVNSGKEKYINLQIDGLTKITQVSQKSDHGDLKLSGLHQNLIQSGVSGTSRSGVKRSPFFIEGFISPEISYRALVANTQYSIPDYGKAYFNKKEKADFTFSTGVSLGFGIIDNIILRSGIFYSRYSLNFKTEAIHLLDAGVDGNLIYTSSGPVSFQLISSDRLSNESVIKSSLNFSYLNIPFIAELHFANNYFINLGLNFNMLAGQNMNWQAENYDGDFSGAIVKPIKGLKSGSFSMIVGLGTEKSVFRNLSLIVNPSFKIFLSSINKTAPVKSYPYVWGLYAGLRYYFN